MAEFHPAAGPRDGTRIRFLDHIRGLIQQRESPFRPRQVRLHVCHLLAHGLQGRIKLRQVAHHQEQSAQRQRAGLNVPHTDEKNRRHAQRRDQRHHKAKTPLAGGQA